MYKNIIFLLVLFLLLVYIKKYIIKENFNTSTVLLSDPFGYQQEIWLKKNKIDPLKYNKDLDNLGNYVKYNKNIKEPQDDKYQVDYTLVTNYLNKCKGKKTFWNFSNADSKWIPKSNKSCKDICTPDLWCQAYLTNPTNNQCYHYNLNKNNIATYKCDKPFPSGAWYGDIKASAVPTIKKQPNNKLIPGQMIALWNPVNMRYMSTNPQLNVVGSTVKNKPLPNTWMWERFLVVDAGDNLIGLWNPYNKLFVRMNPNGNVDSRFNNEGVFPSGWTWEKLKVSYHLDGTISLWNPENKRFIRMNSNGNVDSQFKSDGILPKSWTWERFDVLQLDSIVNIPKRWLSTGIPLTWKQIEIYKGEIYGLSLNGIIWKKPLYSNTSWKQITSGINVKQFSISKDNRIFATNGYYCYYRHYNNWQYLPRSCCFKYIDIYNIFLICGIGYDNYLWLYNVFASKWVQMVTNIKIKQIKLDIKYKTLYSIGMDGYIYYIKINNNSKKYWRRLENVLNDRNKNHFIDVQDNVIYSVNDDNCVYSLNLKFKYRNWNKMTGPHVTHIKVYQNFVYGIDKNYQVNKHVIVPEKFKYTSLGCWIDKPDRAINPSLPDYNPLQRISINKCAEKTAQSGFSIFGLQNGGRCYSSKDADKTFKKYGNALNCVNGTGGNWANNVYKLTSVYDGTIRYNRFFYIKNKWSIGTWLGSCGITKDSCSYYSNLGVGTYKDDAKSYTRTSTNNVQWEFVNKDNPDKKFLEYNDVVTIRLKSNDYYLVSCDLNNCNGNAYLSVSLSKYNGPSQVFSGNSQYWKIVSSENKTGKVRLGDNIKIINLYGNTSYLNSCGWSNICGQSRYYAVNTCKINSYDGRVGVSEWSIHMNLE